MTTVASAQDALPKLIRIVVPFAPGGSNDVIARALAGPLAKRLDATVIVENKPGAAGVIGADFVAKAPRDGSVLLLTSSSFLTAAATQNQLPYDPIAAFAPVAMVGRGPMLLVVSATTPYKSPADVVAAARAKPGVLNYGTAGVGSIAHLTTELMDDTAKIQMTHVPYKGAALAAVDLAGGQIQVMISNYSTVAPLMKSGKIKALAVTSDKPHPAFPDLPPLASVASGFNVDIWVGVFAPAGTPRGDRRPAESRDQRSFRVAGALAGARARRNAAGSDQRRGVRVAHQGPSSASGSRSPPSTRSSRSERRTARRSRS